jgi:hypothetical protein
MEDGIVLIEEQSADIFENSKLQINIFEVGTNIHEGYSPHECLSQPQCCNMFK